MPRSLYALPLAFLLAACDPAALLGGACTDLGVPVFRIEVRDAATGLPAASGARGHVVGPQGRQDLHTYSDLAMGGPVGTGGIYSVFVEKTGYESWQALDVRVAEGRCHVKTRELHIQLQPRPDGPRA